MISYFHTSPVDIPVNSSTLFRDTELTKRFFCTIFIEVDDTVYGGIMTKLDKLKEKLLKRPVDMRFEEVKTILRNHGFENVRTKGSHFFFTDNRNVISIPVHHNTVKKTYLEKIIEILKLED